MWPSHWEILIIFVVVLLLFGAKRIPEMAQGLGKGIREFRKAMKDVQEDIEVSSSPASNIAPKPEVAAAQVAREPAVSSQDAPAPVQAAEQEKQAPQ
jgi:sec-independent protein translocase protein TatA